MNEEIKKKADPEVHEHILVARSMGQEIIEKFQPHEQNEMFRCIQDIIVMNRQNQIEGASAQLQYLQESLEKL